MDNSSSGFNKILGYCITLAAGIVIGFFICKKSGPIKGTPPPVGDSTVSTGQSDTTSHTISDSLAHVLINQYKTENDTAKRPIRNNGGELLRGFFIDRAPLDKILKDKSMNGISVYFAMDSLAHKKRNLNRVYTLIYMGGRYNLHYQEGGSSPKIINKIGAQDTSQYDYIKPCPNACGTFLTEHAAKTTPKK